MCYSARHLLCEIVRGNTVRPLFSSHQRISIFPELVMDTNDKVISNGDRNDDPLDLNNDEDPAAIIKSIYDLEEHLKKGTWTGNLYYIFRSIAKRWIEKQALHSSESWSLPKLADVINDNVIRSVVNIVHLSSESTTIIYRALQLFQSYIYTQITSISSTMALLPPPLKLSLLSAMFV
jgi:hypothetical protein